MKIGNWRVWRASAVMLDGCDIIFVPSDLHFHVDKQPGVDWQLKKEEKHIYICIYIAICTNFDNTQTKDQKTNIKWLETLLLNKFKWLETFLLKTFKWLETRFRG